MANSYYLWQKCVSTGGGHLLTVYPPVFSIDGEGTKDKKLKQRDDPACV
jgi:hypothetical protein